MFNFSVMSEYGGVGWGRVGLSKKGYERLDI